MAAVGSAVCVLAIGVGVAPESTSPSALPRCGPAWRGGPPYFAGTGPFNQPIPTEALVDAGSPGMVEGLVAAGAGNRFVLSVKMYTTPVYYADPRTQRRDVPLTASWAPRRILREVPIPPEARPDPSSDGHLTIVDKSSGCEYDFWGATRLPDGSFTAKWANAISLTRTGVFTHGIPAATASGFALLAGLILPYELRRARIDHALVFGYPYTRAGRPVPPAVGSDGRTEGSQAIPLGARVQLDPQLDLATLDLRPYERTVARALQVYGAYIADTGGAVSFPVAHPQGFRRNPYAGLLPDDTYVSLDRIPLNRFRVLELPR